jgi:hypothetical protein
MSTKGTKRKRSVIWDYFRIVEIAAGDLIKCTIKGCNTSLSYSTGTTSTMWHHLAALHPIQHQLATKLQNGRPSQTTLSSSSTAISSSSTLVSWAMTTVSKKQADQLLAEAWISAGWSFNSINVLLKFSAFISKGSYQLPARTKLTELCDERYDAMHECLMDDIKQQCVSITTDAATLTNGHPYITVTGHYITEQWKMRDVVLAIEAAPGPHGGDHIKHLLESVQERWLLTGRLFAVVTDNGSNFVKAARIMQTCPEKLRCSVHTLQLSIKDRAQSAAPIDGYPWLCSEWRNEQYTGCYRLAWTSSTAVSLALSEHKW